MLGASLLCFMKYTHGKQVKSSTMTIQYFFPSLEAGVIGPPTSVWTIWKDQVVQGPSMSANGSFFIFATVHGSQKSGVPVRELIPGSCPSFTICWIQSIEIWPICLCSRFMLMEVCAASFGMNRTHQHGKGCPDAFQSWPVVFPDILCSDWCFLGRR